MFSLLFVLSALAADRHVEVTGDDVGNDCLDLATPCATLSHAVTMSAAGDTVRLGAGTYASTATDSIQLAEDLRIVGAGRDLTRVTNPVVDSAILLAVSPPVPPVLTIEDLALSNASGGSVEAVGTTDITLRRVDIIDSFYGVRYSEAADGGWLLFEDCRVDDNTVGLSFVPQGPDVGMEITARRTSFDGNDAGAALVQGTQPLTVLFEDVSLDDNRIGLAVDAAAGPSVRLELTRTTLDRNSERGLVVDSDAPTTVRLEGVTVQDPGEGSIVSLFGATTTTHDLDLIDTTFAGTTAGAAFLYETNGGTDLRWTGGGASGAADHGIQLALGFADATLRLEDVDTVGNDGDGLHLTGGRDRRFRWLGGEVRDNGGRGLYETEALEVDDALVGVSFTDNAEAAFRRVVSSTSTPARSTLVDVTMQRNGSYVDEYNGPGAVRISGSRFEETPAAWRPWALSPVDIRMTHTTFTGAALEGLRLSISNSATGTVDLDGLELSDNGYGLSMSAAGPGDAPVFRLGNSTITGNTQAGLVGSMTWSSAVAVWENNTIQDNGDPTLGLSNSNANAGFLWAGAAPLDGTRNWWGTDDAAAIAARSTTDLDLSTVYADPFVVLGTAGLVPAGHPTRIRLEASEGAFVPRAGDTTLSVTVGGEPLTNVEVSGDGTALTADLPALPPGTADIVVTNPAGQQGLGSLEIVATPPVLLSLTATPARLGDTMTITLSGVPAGAPVRLLASPSRTGAPFCPASLGSCAALAAPVPLQLPATGTGGDLTWDVPLPPAAPSEGVVLQAIARSGGTFLASDLVATPWLSPGDDTDADGVPNASDPAPLDPDRDDDTCVDGEDAAADTPSVDADEDGLPDDCW